MSCTRFFGAKYNFGTSVLGTKSLINFVMALIFPVRLIAYSLIFKILDKILTEQFQTVIEFVFLMFSFNQPNLK